MGLRGECLVIAGSGSTEGLAGRYDLGMTTPRLYVAQDLYPDAALTLPTGPSHYLATVLRIKPGAAVLVFNGRDGEWCGRVAEAGRKATVLHLDVQTRAQVEEPGAHLLFAPIKKARLDFLVEKAVELGASRLTPVLTRHTVVDKVKTDRLAATMTEAAEQCERLSLPRLDPPVRLSALLDGWAPENALHVAVARADEAAWPDAVAVRAEPAVLVGPEGGFSSQEEEALRAHPAVRPVSLGSRVLRAETAAIAALAAWQASGANAPKGGPADAKA